jgi:hypothetical protein
MFYNSLVFFIKDLRQTGSLYFKKDYLIFSIFFEWQRKTRQIVSR